MAFFDKLGENISRATNKAAQSVKTMTEVGSLNSQISVQKDIINAAYIAIGRSYAETHAGDTEGEYGERIKTIKAAGEKIAELQSQVDAVKGFITCPNCGAKIPAGAAFCPGCGTRAPEPAPGEDCSEKICPNCGAKVAADSAFCPNCGTKIGQ